NGLSTVPATVKMLPAGVAANPKSSRTVGMLGSVDQVPVAGSNASTVPTTVLLPSTPPMAYTLPLAPTARRSVRGVGIDVGDHALAFGSNSSTRFHGHIEVQGAKMAPLAPPMA